MSGVVLNFGVGGSIAFGVVVPALKDIVLDERVGRVVFGEASPFFSGHGKESVGVTR